MSERPARSDLGGSSAGDPRGSPRDPFGSNPTSPFGAAKASPFGSTPGQLRVAPAQDPFAPVPRRALIGAPLGVPDEMPPPVAPVPPRERRIRRLARRARGLARRLIPFGSGVAAMLAAILIYNAANPTAAPLSKRDVTAAIKGALASMTPGPALSAQAYRAVMASVVLIRVREPDTKSDSWDRLGSGVVVDDKGDILTSLHVIDGAAAIQVTFADGSQSAASVSTSKAETDSAVLRADNPPATIPAATMGNPSSLRVGDEAYALGSPFGLYGSLSAGVVSALDRSFQVPGTSVTLTGLIQVDAAVNPGNSGGPLVDRNGTVVGIVTALINPTKEDVFVGIGLAVPIDAAGGAAGLPPY